MKGLKNQIMKKTSLFICTLLFISSIVFYPKITLAYPFWAQQNYESPREATGKIVCANCHLAQMPTIAEVPQSVGADSVFKAVVKIPYKNDLKEIGADGSEVPLQVGAVVMLPDCTIVALSRAICVSPASNETPAPPVEMLPDCVISCMDVSVTMAPDVVIVPDWVRSACWTQ